MRLVLSVFLMLFHGEMLAAEVDDSNKEVTPTENPAPTIAEVSAAKAVDKVNSWSQSKPTISANLRFGADMISFQDIYVPLSKTDYFRPHLRADGKVRKEDMQDNLGFGIGFAMGISYARADYIFLYNLHYRRTGASIGMDGVGEATSYASLVSDVSALYAVTPDMHFGIGLSGKRLVFSNISQGHMLLSLLPRAEFLLLATPKTQVSGYAGYALLNRFAYYKSFQLVGNNFDNAKIKSGEVGLEVRQRLVEQVTLSVGISQHMTSIHLRDIGIYKNFGLSLRTDNPTPRNIALTTRIISIGLRKELGGS